MEKRYDENRRAHRGLGSPILRCCRPPGLSMAHGPYGGSLQEIGLWNGLEGRNLEFRWNPEAGACAFHCLQTPGSVMAYGIERCPAVVGFKTSHASRKPSPRKLRASNVVTR